MKKRQLHMPYPLVGETIRVLQWLKRLSPGPDPRFDALLSLYQEPYRAAFDEARSQLHHHRPGRPHLGQRKGLSVPSLTLALSPRDIYETVAALSILIERVEVERFTRDAISSMGDVIASIDRIREFLQSNDPSARDA